MDQINQENELQRAIDNITNNGGEQPGQGGDVAAGLEEQIQNQMGTPPVPPMPPMGEGEAVMPAPEGAEAPAEMPAEAGESGVAEATGTEASGAAEAPAGAPQGVEGQQASGDAPQGAGSEVMTDELSDAGEMGAPAEIAVGSSEVVTDGLSDAAPVMTETAAVELNDMGGNDINGIKEAMLRDLFPIMDKVEMGAEEKFELYRTMLDENNDKSLIAGAYEVVRGIADETARAEALLFLIKKADA